MFLNLFQMQDSTVFRDFNFSDFWNESGGPAFEKIPEKEIRRYILESYRPLKFRSDRFAGLPPEFDPIFRLTISKACAESFIRTNPELPITTRDYVLSKAFQFLFLTIALRFRPDGTSPDDTEVSDSNGIQWELQEGLNRVSDEDLAKITDPDLNWWWDVYDDALRSDVGTVLSRFSSRMKSASEPKAQRKKREQITPDSEREVSLTAVIREKTSVTYARAAEFLGCSERHIRRLAEHGKLERVGRGQVKQITTSSLRRYKGTPTQ